MFEMVVEVTRCSKRQCQSHVPQQCKSSTYRSVATRPDHMGTGQWCHVMVASARAHASCTSQHHAYQHGPTQSTESLCTHLQQAIHTSTAADLTPSTESLYKHLQQAIHTSTAAGLTQSTESLCTRPPQAIYTSTAAGLTQSTASLCTDTLHPRKSLTPWKESHAL